LAIALPQLFKHPALEGFTGGVSGLSLDAKAWATWFGTIKAEHVALYECVAWGGLAWLALARIVAGPAGIAWYALRDQPVAATAAGVNVRFWKATAFGLSAALAGLAGSLNTALTHFVSPDSYGVFLSLFLLVGVSIAGSTSGLGALAGGLFLVFVPDIAERINKDATGFIFGAIMLACVYITPAGAWLRQRLARLRGGKPSFPEQQEIN
jgi:branched-chain amino acid transport system permease protein